MVHATMELQDVTTSAHPRRHPYASSHARFSDDESSYFANHDSEGISRIRRRSGSAELQHQQVEQVAKQSSHVTQLVAVSQPAKSRRKSVLDFFLPSSDAPVNRSKKHESGGCSSQDTTEYDYFDSPSTRKGASSHDHFSESVAPGPAGRKSGDLVRNQSLARNMSMARHQSALRNQTMRESRHASRSSSMARSLSLHEKRGSTTGYSERSSVPGSPRSAGEEAGETVAVGEEEEEEKPKTLLPIYPDNYWYKRWFELTVALALMTAWEEPFKLAFLKEQDLMPISAWSITQLLTTVVFAADMCLHFVVVKRDVGSNVLAETLPAIRAHYMRSMFAVDLLSVIPIDTIVMVALGIEHTNNTGSNLVFVALLKYIKLLRVHRVFQWCLDLERRRVLSQLMGMLTRNLLYVLLFVHWSACIWWLMARRADTEHTGAPSWIGRNPERFIGNSPVENYILSYYCIMSFYNGIGDNDMYESTLGEALFLIVFLLISIVVSCYIIGTLQMLIVKADKRAKKLREQIDQLGKYGKLHSLAPVLHDSMQQHLHLHHEVQNLADEVILKVYPAAIRRKAVRHMYLNIVQLCYLFAGCSEEFLNTMLAMCRVELFMPQLRILVEGDPVIDLNVLLAGSAELLQPMAADAADASPSKHKMGSFASLFQPRSSNSGNTKSGGGGGWGFSRGDSGSVRGGDGSSHGGSRHRGSSNGGASGRGDENKSFGGGDSFFGGGGDRGSARDAGGHSMASSRMTSFMSGLRRARGKTLEVDGQSFQRVAGGDMFSSQSFQEVSFFTDQPCDVRVAASSVTRVLSCSRTSWKYLADAFPQQVMLVYDNCVARYKEDVCDILRKASAQGQMLDHLLPSALEVVTNAAESGHLSNSVMVEASATLSEPAKDAIQRLRMLLEVTLLHSRALIKITTYSFLQAAASGDTEHVRLQLTRGISPDVTDYDGRTAAMLAAYNGHEALLSLLMLNDADLTMRDNFGNTAVYEAVKGNHPKVLELLLHEGVKLDMDGVSLACQMCDYVYQRDLKTLRTMLQLGADPNSADYDARTALHIAAAEGNLVAVRMLVEEANASLLAADRWNNLPFDEALRVGAADVVEYMIPRLGVEQVKLSRCKLAAAAATNFVKACLHGNAKGVKGMTEGDHQPPCLAAGTLLAAALGHTDVVRTLLDAVGSLTPMPRKEQPSLRAATPQKPTPPEICMQPPPTACKPAPLPPSPEPSKTVRTYELDGRVHMTAVSPEPNQKPSISLRSVIPSSNPATVAGLKSSLKPTANFSTSSDPQSNCKATVSPGSAQQSTAQLPSTARSSPSGNHIVNGRAAATDLGAKSMSQTLAQLLLLSALHARHHTVAAELCQAGCSLKGAMGQAGAGAAELLRLAHANGDVQQLASLAVAGVA